MLESVRAYAWPRALTAAAEVAGALTVLTQGLPHVGGCLGALALGLALLRCCEALPGMSLGSCSAEVPGKFLTSWSCRRVRWPRSSEGMPGAGGFPGGFALESICLLAVKDGIGGTSVFTACPTSCLLPTRTASAGILCQRQVQHFVCCA